mgnify:CR=1 FL=1
MQMYNVNDDDKFRKGTNEWCVKEREKGREKKERVEEEGER